jgi:hypothetical protein
LLEDLFDKGEEEYAISLITSDLKKSCLKMLRIGSTMTTEGWDGYYKPNPFCNHVCGSVPATVSFVIYT